MSKNERVDFVFEKGILTKPRVKSAKKDLFVQNRVENHEKITKIHNVIQKLELKQKRIHEFVLMKNNLHILQLETLRQAEICCLKLIQVKQKIDRYN